jgi:hypothetical protein
VRFGSQARGREGWNINNPKAKIIRCMLQLLQQRAGSGPLLASLKMPVWEPYSRMFRMWQSNAATAEAQKPSALPTSKQMNTTPEDCMNATQVRWKCSKSMNTQHRDTEICRILRWNQSNHCSSGRCFRKLLIARKQEYLLLGGDRAGFNAVLAEQDNIMFNNHARQYWGVWVEAANQ